MGRRNKIVLHYKTIIENRSHIIDTIQLIAHGYSKIQFFFLFVLFQCIVFLFYFYVVVVMI